MVKHIEINNEKLHVIQFELNTPDDTAHITYEQTLVLLTNIHTIKLTKTMYSPDEQASLFSTRSHPPPNPFKIVLTYDRGRNEQAQRDDFERAHFSLFDSTPPASLTIENLIANLKNGTISGASHLNLVFPWNFVPPEMFEELLRLYQEEGEPTKLFRSIKISEFMTEDLRERF